MQNCIVCLIDSLRYDVPTETRQGGLLDRGLPDSQFDTPNLDRIANAGTKIPNFHTTFTATPPATASLLTGLYPREHRLCTFQHALKPGVTSLPEIFENNGYHTILMNGLDLFHTDGIGDLFQEHLTGPFFRGVERIRELNSSGTPVFLYLHSFDVHRPYLMSRYPPDSEYHQPAVEAINQLSRRLGDNREFSLPDALPEEPGDDWPGRVSNSEPLYQYMIDFQKNHPEKYPGLDDTIPLLMKLYSRGVSHFDRNQLKPLVDFALDSEIGRKSTFLFTADHGESIRFMDNSPTFYHGGEPKEDIIRVPGYVLHPELEGCSFDNWPVTSLVDVFPTLTTLHSLEPATKTSGLDLTGSEPDRRQVFAENNPHSEGDLPEDTETPPTGAVLRFVTAIDSRGLKYNRVGHEPTEADYHRDLREFVRRVWIKTNIISVTYEFLEDYVEKLKPIDSRENRELFYEQMAQNDKLQKGLYRWKQDPLEQENLLDNPTESAVETAEELDRILQAAFPDILDLKLYEPSEQDEEKITEALKGLGYL